MPPQLSKSKTRIGDARRLKNFQDELAARLALRKTVKHGRVYHFEFRSGDFKLLGRSRQMLCNPRPIGKSADGEPTSDVETAKRWIEEHYAAAILREMDVARASTQSARANDGPMTVTRACDSYLKTIEGTKGRSKSTFRNRRSYIEKTIKPRLGHLPLSALDHDRVERMLDEMEVEVVNDDGVRVRQPAAEGTRDFVRGTLTAVWRHAMRGVPLPFEGPALGSGDTEMARRFRQEITEGRLKSLVSSIFRDDLPRNLRQMLIAAMWYDRTRITGRRNMSRRAIANTAAALAAFVSHGLRLEESTYLQWFCVREDLGIIIVPGTKSAAGLRAVPLQAQFRPWLALLRELARPEGAPADWQPHEDDFVFLTRPGDPRRRGSTRALANRISEAIRWAGLKKRGEATHVGRKILASMVALRITREQLKQYLGHADAFKGATADYVLPMIDAIPPEHRHLVQYLPSPAELLVEVDTFQPAERPDLAQRKQRAAEAKARKAREAEHGESSDSAQRELDVA